jgi:hypothetical protein
LWCALRVQKKFQPFGVLVPEQLIKPLIHPRTCPRG